MIVLSPTAINIAQAVSILRSGGIVAHATETCYGFACDLGNADAVAKLFRIKKRPETQPVSALFASLNQAKEYLLWNDRAEELAKELPGPLTLILPLRSDAPTSLFPIAPYMRADRTHVPITIGLRLSPNPIARALVEQFGRPISTTSANLHGLPSPYSAKEIVAQYENEDAKPDLILDSGILERRPPSKIVDLTAEDERILRP